MTNAKDLKDDDYETPSSAFRSVLPYVPRDAVVWDPFYGSGASGDHLRSMGLNVIHQKEDFFAVDRGDFVLTNPPFSKKKEVLTRLKELGKPFLVLLPASVLGTKMLRTLFPDIQVLIPNGRISFVKNGTQTKAVWFASFWYGWKLRLPRDITFLP
jgi:hypothetical protein